MGRMLDALKTLEDRAHPAAVEPPAQPSAATVDWEMVLEETQGLLGESSDFLGSDLPPLITDPLEEIPAPPPLPAKSVLPAAPFERCILPTVDQPAAHYLEISARIASQLATNYSNVLLFVAADRWAESAFSMTQLAQCFAHHASGDVLLIDGDLRTGRLSKEVSRPGSGMIEAMLGQAQWPDIIHPTNVARIDFVARGNGQVPTFERPQFGWSALRPMYRAVLIGLASASEPETNWLAGRCDAVYYLVSRPHTRRSHATATVNALRASGANLAGCIVVDD